MGRRLDYERQPRVVRRWAVGEWVSLGFLLVWAGGCLGWALFVLRAGRFKSRTWWGTIVEVRPSTHPIEFGLAVGVVAAVGVAVAVLAGVWIRRGPARSAEADDEIEPERRRPQRR